MKSLRTIECDHCNGTDNTYEQINNSNALLISNGYRKVKIGNITDTRKLKMIETAYSVHESAKQP